MGLALILAQRGAFKSIPFPVHKLEFDSEGFKIIKDAYTKTSRSGYIGRLDKKEFPYSNDKE
jgi:hypothetical protein